jgi:putative ABC transport system permease protein
MKTSLPNATEKEEIQTRMNFVGYNYLQLFEHKFLAGRNFSEKLKTDQSGVVINKRMTAMYGFSNPQDAIGKEIQWKIMNRTKVIIGVVDDFLQQSAENEIEPLMFHLWDNASGYSIVNIETKDAQSCFLSIQKLWNRIHPENPFEYVWVDDVYAQQFSRWRQYSRMATLLSTIAILIACIGLFGLTSLILSQRTKEIGIRKVNGAKISEIMQLINSGFIKWVIIAFIIAVPVAYLTIGKWLENFAYQTTLSWWIFVLAGVMALGIALLTVSWQSWKAATRNPVEALRYE